MPEEYRLYAGREKLHIKIKKVYEKGHGKKAACPAEYHLWKFG